MAYDPHYSIGYPHHNYWYCIVSIIANTDAPQIGLRLPAYLITSPNVKAALKKARGHPRTVRKGFLFDKYKAHRNSKDQGKFTATTLCER